MYWLGSICNSQSSRNVTIDELLPIPVFGEDDIKEPEILHLDYIHMLICWLFLGYSQEFTLCLNLPFIQQCNKTTLHSLYPYIVQRYTIHYCQ